MNTFLRRLILGVLSLIAITSCTSAADVPPATQESQSMPQPAEAYTGLRSQILAANPNEIGIKQNDTVRNVWGVLMEFQTSGAVITLVSLADGTTSMYFSNGGGIIGFGQYDEVATASKDFVATAETFYAKMNLTTEFPPPSKNRVKFYVLTFSGKYTADVGEDELVKRKDDLSPLFYAGTDVIDQIRLHASPAK